MNARTLAPVLSLLLILGVHQQLQAQTPGYFLYSLTAAELPGSTEVQGYKVKNAVEVLSFSFNGNNSVTIGSSGGSAGTVQFNPLELVITDDPGILPGLLLNLAEGFHHDDLVLEGAILGSGGGNPEVFFKLELKLCILSGVSLSGTDGDRAVFNVALEWGAMRISTWKRLPNGTLEAVTPRSWSRVKNNNTFTVQ